MSQAQLETQIQRKRTELDILTKDQTALESAKHDLSEEYKERNENYERLRERLEADALRLLDVVERRGRLRVGADGGRDGGDERGELLPVVEVEGRATEAHGLLQEDHHVLPL